MLYVKEENDSQKKVILHTMTENNEGKQRSKDQMFALIKKSIATSSRVISESWKTTCSIPWASLGMLHEFCIHSATKAAVENKKSDTNSKISVLSQRKNIAKLASKRAELIEKAAKAKKEAAFQEILLSHKEKKAGKRISKDKKKKAADAKVKKTKEHVKRSKPVKKRIVWVNANGYHTNGIESEWNRCKNNCQNNLWHSPARILGLHSRSIPFPPQSRRSNWLHVQN